MEMFNEKFLCEKEFVVLDIETTGFTPEKGGRIIEIGAVKVKDGQVIDEFSTFVNPLIKVPKKITEITGITNEMVANAPVINNVLPKFKEFIGDILVVAHNADFDWNRFLIPFFKKSGIIPTNNVLDTVTLSKKIFPKEKKHNLKSLCERLEIPIENHHRALDDCKITAKVYLKLIELGKENNNISSQIDLFSKDKEDEVMNIKSNEEQFNPEIKRVSYWELKNSKRLIHSRHYVLFKNGKKFGNVFFDIKNQCWTNKDYIGEIDFKILQEKVLKFLSLKDLEEFSKYRTK